MPENTKNLQIAVLVERIDHLTRHIDTLSTELKPLTTSITSLNTELEHAKDTIKQIATINQLQGENLHKLDKRTIVLERWHKFMLATPAILLTIVLTIGSYLKGLLNDLDDFKNETRDRITSLEFIVTNNNQHTSAAELRYHERTEEEPD